MKFVPSLLGGASALVLSLPSIASAHVCLDVPASRAADMCQSHDLLEAAINTDQKIGPCGSSKGRMANPTVYKPGETITVKWTETIDHQPSWYRISFNPNGEMFEDPTSYQDNTGKHPNTLKDGIQDGSSAAQEIQVTLPNITCDKCTLQLIQVMGDKGGNGFGGNDGSGGKADNDDLYYACADIILRGDVAAGDAGTVGDAAVADAAVQGDAGAVASVDAGSLMPTTGGTGTGTAGTTAGGAGGTSGTTGTAGGGVGGATGGNAAAGTGGAQPIGGGPVVGQTPPEESDDGCSLAPGANRPVAGASALGFIALAFVRRRRAAATRR